jgi:polyisoprenyl-teichoic acid--peptidoglycan teichoic acid transferase
MGRLTDALICVLALTIALLAGREAAPVVESLVSRDGVLARIALGAPAFGGADRVRILLIGADKRHGDRGRSDTLLLLTLNPRTHRMTLLGMPRDLRVSVPGHGRTKINHSYAYGGPALTRQTVSDFLGVKVDYHALVFFGGFVQAVDALGGVTVDVPDVEGHGRGMNYDDNAGNLHIHLKPGRRHLDGRQALGFVRYRQSNIAGLGDSDEARSGRQQQFLRALAEQHLRPTSLPGLMAAARLVRATVQTDMTPAAVADLIRTLHASGPDAMLTATVPLAPSNWHGHGTYYAYADYSALQALQGKFEKHLDTGPNPPLSIECLNASGAPGRARDCAAQLARKGLKGAHAGNASTSDLIRTRIEYVPDRAREAKRARSALGCGELRQVSPQAGQARPDIRVLVGRDYKPATGGH